MTRHRVRRGIKSDGDRLRVGVVGIWGEVRSMGHDGRSAINDQRSTRKWGELRQIAPLSLSQNGLFRHELGNKVKIVSFTMDP